MPIIIKPTIKLKQKFILLSIGILFFSSVQIEAKDSFSVIRIDDKNYDKVIVDALMKSMTEVSQSMIPNVKDIYLNAINSQTKILIENTDAYIKWYFSYGRKTDILLNSLAGTIKGEKTPEEKYFLENFNNIMYKDTEIEDIVKEDIDNILGKILGLFNKHLTTMGYFSVKTELIPIESMTKNEFISAFNSEILKFIEQVNEVISVMDNFYAQDYIIDNVYLGLLRQNIESEPELKKKILDRLYEIQENKKTATNDPYNYIFENIKIGTILYVENYFVGFNTYQHYGVYIGDGKVIHYAPLEGQEISFENGIIHETTLEKFLGGRALRFIKDTEPTYPEEEIIQRAKSRLGEKEYNLILNNCEHFARWCITGNHHSYQVRNFPDRVNETWQIIEEGYDTVKKIIEIFK